MYNATPQTIKRRHEKTLGRDRSPKKDATRATDKTFSTLHPTKGWRIMTWKRIAAAGKFMAIARKLGLA